MSAPNMIANSWKMLFEDGRYISDIKFHPNEWDLHKLVSAQIEDSQDSKKECSAEVVWHNVTQITVDKLIKDCGKEGERPETSRHFQIKLEQIGPAQFYIHIYRQLPTVPYQVAPSISPSSFETVSNGEELVLCLKRQKKDVILLNCINYMARYLADTMPEIQEIIAILSSLDKDHRRLVIDHFSREVRTSVVKNYALIEGLTQALDFFQYEYSNEIIKNFHYDRQLKIQDVSDTELEQFSRMNPAILPLDTDSLVQICSVLCEQLKKSHKTEKNPVHLHYLLNALRALFETMFIVHVQKLDRKKYYQPTYDVLELFENHSDFDVAFAAAYSFQSLVKIGNDEKLPFLRRSLHFLKGLAALVSVFNLETGIPNNPSGFFEAWDEFKKTFAYMRGVKSWFLDLRAIEYLVLERDQAVSLKSIINQLEDIVATKKIGIDTHHPLFIKGLMGVCKKVIERAPDREAAKDAFNILSRIGLENLKSANGLFTVDTQHHKDAVPWIEQMHKDLLWTFNELTFFSDPSLREIADNGFEKLAEGVVNSYAITEIPLPPVDYRRLQEKKVVGTTLFDKAIEAIAPWQRGLRFWFKEFAHQPELIKEIEFHIPLKVKKDGAERLPLEQEISLFLEDPKSKVLLLTGAAGSGKSLSSKLITTTMWQPEKWRDYIPIFIPLPILKRPFTEAIEEVLQSYMPLNSLKEMHDRPYLFIFDAYDEVVDATKKDASNRFRNLYEENNIYKWKNSKVIITCRIGDSTMSLSHFQPLNGTLLKLTIEPLKADDIRNYLNQFIRIRQETGLPTPWETAEEYMQYVEKCAVLEDLLNSPFYLRVIAVVLPYIVQKMLKDIEGKPSIDEIASKLSGLTENDYLKVLICSVIEREVAKKKGVEGKYILYAVTAVRILMTQENSPSLNLPSVDSVVSEKLKSILKVEQRGLWKKGGTISDYTLSRALKVGLLQPDTKTKTFQFTHLIMYDYINHLIAHPEVFKEIENDLREGTYNPINLFPDSVRKQSVYE